MDILVADYVSDTLLLNTLIRGKFIFFKKPALFSLSMLLHGFWSAKRRKYGEVDYRGVEWTIYRENM
jgi:hypothetical protein